MVLNLIFSLFGSIFLLMGNISELIQGSLTITGFSLLLCRYCMLIFISVGFVPAAFLYFQFNKHELPLYYNKNISLPVYIGAAYAMHLVIASVVLLVISL